MAKIDDLQIVLSGNKPEYIPWFADLDYWMNYLRDEKLIPEKYKIYDDPFRLPCGLSDDGLQALHRDLDVGFYLQAYFPFRTIYHNVKMSYEEKDGFQITCYQTPYGNLKEVWKYIESTYSYAPLEYLIKSVDDMKALLYIYQNMEYVPDYDLAKKRLDSVQDNGIVVVYTPKTPMMELVALKAGLETVVMELMDVEDLFDELMACMDEKHTQATQIAIESPADYIFVPDNLSSEMVGGAIYDNYIDKVHKKWTKMIKDADKTSMVHLDGTLNPLLNKLAHAGFRIIEAVTPSPVGDIELKELRKHVLEDTIIWGGLPSGFFSEDVPQGQFEVWVRTVIAHAKQDGKFVMGVGDQIVPGTSFERIKRVSQLLKEE